MDKIIDARFQRVEKALTTLISSIATYNASPLLAADLLAADHELSAGLTQLSQHQANHARLVALRTASTNLDTQIKDTLTLLTSTRSELLNTPATTFPHDASKIAYQDLLRYASRISKFTRPPTFREPDPAAVGTVEGAETASEDRIKTPASGAQTNGASTPAAAGAAAAAAGGVNGSGGEDTKRTGGTGSRAASESTPAAGAGGAGPLATTSEGGEGSAGEKAEHQTTLPEAYSKWLDPLSDMPFLPWPTEETIRRGALASIQILLDQGIDPATFDPEQSAALEEERKRREEEEERLREEQKAREEEERRREMERRRGSVIAPTRQEDKPKVFMGLDFLDEDED